MTRAWLLTLALPASARAQQWTFHGVVVPGEQLDASGAVLLTESHGDPVQNPTLLLRSRLRAWGR